MRVWRAVRPLAIAGREGERRAEPDSVALIFSDGTPAGGLVKGHGARRYYLRESHRVDDDEPPAARRVFRLARCVCPTVGE